MMKPQGARPSEKTWRPIAEAIADYHCVKVNEMLYRQERVNFVPRVLFWMTLREMGYSFPAIGSVTGHDHTSVLAGLKSKSLAYDSVPVLFARRRKKRATQYRKEQEAIAIETRLNAILARMALNKKMAPEAFPRPGPS